MNDNIAAYIQHKMAEVKKAQDEKKRQEKEMK